MTFDQFLAALRTADEQATKGGLLPCPFCGSAPAIHRDSDIVSIACENVACSRIRLRTSWTDESDAIAAWNRRASRNSLAQTIAIMEVARKALEDIIAIGKEPKAIRPSIYRATDIADSALAEIDALAAKTP